MRNLVIGTAGHIDHGKTTLVRTLTGIDPDRLKEEQERGITIDLGFAHAEINGVAVAFIDVPGHERFVRNMLAGAGGIDAVLLVVAADESVMPQTREHFQICRLLGIERAVVAITKSDLVDPDTLAVVELDIRELLAGSGLADAALVPVSARTGAGLDALSGALARLANSPPHVSRDDVVRLPVDRVFTMRGFGAVVTGTLVSGRVEEGQELIALPEQRRVRVRGIQRHGQAVPMTAAPHRVALNVSGIDKEALGRGMTIASVDGLTVTRRIDSHIELLPSAAPLRHGARVRLHQGTAEVAARVLVGAIRGGPSESWRAVAPGELGVAVPAGGEGYVRLRIDGSLVVTRGDRFVLRTLSPAATIGGGTVLDPEPPAGGLRRGSALSRFLDLQTTDGALAVWTKAAGARGLPIGALVTRGGLSRSDAEHMSRRAIEAGRAVRIGDSLFDAPLVASLREAVKSALATFHASQPLESGMPREALRDVAVAGRGSAALFESILTELARDLVIKGTERVALTTHRPVLSDAEALTRASVLAAIHAAGLSGADATELAQKSGSAAAIVDRVAHLLIREQQIVRLDVLYFETAALRRLKDDVQAMRNESSGARLDVGTFKSRFGLTRRSAIPLLEWLDRERVTRRSGETRLIL